MNELTNFYKLLSDETRIRILVLLKNKKLCVCQLTGIMDESQPKISKHLAKLRDQGIIKDERKEQFIFYTVSTDNKFYLQTLDNIMDSIEFFPLLKQDLERSQQAENYLNL